MTEVTEVEMMDYEEINDWLTERMQNIDHEDFRAIVTMAVMISTTQDFFDENPDCYVRLIDFWESDEIDQLH
jgi:hypothetical protein